jgi:pimeloyl-ACP methyl ester carboxylesterase
MSEEFCDVGRGITLCYETFGEPSDPPMLLIMGLATQMIAWNEDLCKQLAGRGFHVIRFDNRDIGRSTHSNQAPPTTTELLIRRVPGWHYTLSDMAEDTAGLLRELDLAPAHVVGASMGGMIGQLLAAEHPESVRSLTSIMSNTGDRLHGQPSLGVYKYFITKPPRTREEVVNRATEIFGVVGSKGLHDLQELRELVGRSYDRDHDAAAGGRQLGAIAATGDRTKLLRRITAPALVIHGTDDKLIKPSGGKATAKAIPGSKLLLIEGMGHDLPRLLWPRLIDAIAAHAHDADAARGTVSPRARDARVASG